MNQIKQAIEANIPEVFLTGNNDIEKVEKMLDFMWTEKELEYIEDSRKSKI